MSGRQARPRFGWTEADGLRGDIARMFSETGTSQGRPTPWAGIEKALTRPGALAVLLYRASHRLWSSGRHTPAELLWRLNLFLTGADIHPGAAIGGGLRLTHVSGIVISREATIGRNVTILQGVTVGGSGKGWFDETIPDGSPTIGDETEIYAGAKVLGPITVGRACHIGANAVVSRDLADGTAWTAASPLRELKRRVGELEEVAGRLEKRVAELEAGGDRSQPGQT